MSLPPENLDWRIEPAKLAGLRIGLLLEAGCGYPTSAPTRAALERAAQDFAAAGAVVEPLAPFLTQDMLDGLDRFWRMRALIDFRATPPERRQKILPFIRAWGESAADFSGETVFHGFSQMLVMRKAAVDGNASLRLRHCADRADHGLCRRACFAERRSARSVSAYQLHGRLQHVGAAGRFDQLRL